MGRYGDVFGFAFALEGTSFFVEAIFVAIYIYGWDRLKERTHFLVGLPIPSAGLFGSLFVISVNGWMNNPVGFDETNGVVSNIRPLEALVRNRTSSMKARVGPAVSRMRAIGFSQELRAARPAGPRAPAATAAQPALRQQPPAERQLHRPGAHPLRHGLLLGR
jgi:cytochrome d ubiquinol oxidase subunit I